MKNYALRPSPIIVVEIPRTRELRCRLHPATWRIPFRPTRPLPSLALSDIDWFGALLFSSTAKSSVKVRMSKPPGAPGGGAGNGPTAAASAAAVQKQKSLMLRLDSEIGNIVDHFTQLVSVSRVNEPPVRNSQDSFQMEVRAARMTQAADVLLKLVSELKQTALFSGFASLNENVERRIAVLDKEAESTERLLERIGEEAAASLKELETHYYSSVMRTAIEE